MYLCDLLMVLENCEVEIVDKDGKHISYGTYFKDVFPISNQKVLKVTTGRSNSIIISLKCEVNDEKAN